MKNIRDHELPKPKKKRVRNTRVRFEQKRILNICYDCTAKPVPGHARCQFHLDKNKGKFKALSEQRRANSQCVYCGRFSTSRRCVECKQKDKRYRGK